MSDVFAERVVEVERQLPVVIAAIGAAPDEEVRVRILRDFYWKARWESYDDFIRGAMEGQNRGAPALAP
jgi:hypothetical protein